MFARKPDQKPFENHQLRAEQPQPVPPIPMAPMAPPAHMEQLTGVGHSIIGEDLTIEGQSITIRCLGTLQINGNIQADLHSKALVVGESGVVHGSIAADAVDIHGQVSGSIMGSRVVLHPSASVEGDIHAKSLSIVDGASFEGRSRKVADSASIAPQLGSAGAAPSQHAPGVPVPMPRQAVPVNF